MKKFTSELKNALYTSAPIILANMVEVVMRLIDQYMLSQFGKPNPEILISAVIGGGIASLAVGAPIIITVQYINAIASQASGLKTPQQASLALSQAIFFCFIASPFLLFILPYSQSIFLLFQHSPQLADLESQYFNILISGNVVFALRAAFSSFMTGIGRPKTVMYANICGMLCNIPLNFLFIFGYRNLPAMGIQGAAIATLLSGAIILLTFLTIYFSPNMIATYNSFRQLRWNRKLFFSLLRFGVPAGLEGTIQITFFNLFLLIMNSYGQYIASAVSIAITWDNLMYNPLLGLSFATTAIAGFYLGAKQISKAQDTTKTMLILAACYVVPVILLFFFAAPQLVQPFLKKSENPIYTIQYAIPMIQIAGIYTIGEAIYQVFSGFLRSAGDTLWILSINFISRLVLILLVYLSVHIWHLNPITSWWIFVVFTFINGAGVCFRYFSRQWINKIELLHSKIQ